MSRRQAPWTDVVALAVHDVTVRFAGLTALDHLSFTVEPGTVHALIGPNGAGKSSCFNVLTGVYRASEGFVQFGGTRLTGLRPHDIARLGIGRTFQNLALAPRATVAENLMRARHALTSAGFVATGLRLPLATREQRRHLARVRDIAEFVGVEDQLGELTGALPYGIQKKVELARALATEPRLLLLDEPVAGLNASESRDMAQLILQLRDELGLSVLVVEHDMPLVMAIADRVTVLDFGRRIADGRPDVVRHDPAVVRAYLGGSPDSDLVATLATRLPSDAGPDGSDAEADRR